jgi:hypothetical protein
MPPRRLLRTPAQSEQYGQRGACPHFGMHHMLSRLIRLFTPTSLLRAGPCGGALRIELDLVAHAPGAIEVLHAMQDAIDQRMSQQAAAGSGRCT